jgi:hypothetical protein
VQFSDQPHLLGGFTTEPRRDPAAARHYSGQRLDRAAGRVGGGPSPDEIRPERTARASYPVRWRRQQQQVL